MLLTSFWNNSLLCVTEQNIFMLLPLASVWRHTPLLFCRNRRAACLCKLSSQFFSRWQDAVVWTRARELGNGSRRRKQAQQHERRKRRENTQQLKSYLVFSFPFTCFTTDTRLCSSKPCAGNATCIETGQGGYMCICPRGYMGDNCQLKPGLCFSNR